MNQFDTPYFSTEFILEYSKGGNGREKRVQTYVAYRFLSALIKKEPVLIKALEEHGASPIHRKSFITHFKVKE